jgi:four helix bundle protein
MATKPIQQLDIYKLSEALSDIMWHLYDEWNYKAQRTIGLQVIDSADSIAANLAEGYGRFTPKDRNKFYLYSRGSFEETKAWLRKAIRRKLISKDIEKKLTGIINELGPKLNSFINKSNQQF